MQKDYEFAYIWFHVGASHEHALSKEAINKTKKKLSQEELNEADKLITNYIQKYEAKSDVDPNQLI